MPKSPSVLFVSSECAPFVKAGGLGDVVGALPIALRSLGCDARVVMPRYDVIPTRGMKHHDSPLGIPFGAGEAWAGIAESTLPKSDVPVYFLDHEALFARGYLYDPPGSAAPDNLVRFGILCRGALQLCKHLGWFPDVIHVHDWPTALIPVYLNTVEANGPLARTATVLTIHNLAHQAKFDRRELALCQIPMSEFRADSLEDMGGVNPLKGGLYHATKLTTVSPTYADEIRSPDGGNGLDGLLRFRGGDLVGILNGIDDSVWNPADDPALVSPYSARDLAGKLACKRALQRELGLAVRDDVPLIGIISRLNQQKGTDVILSALGRLLDLDIQVVILGSGDPAAEGYLSVRSRHGGGPLIPRLDRLQRRACPSDRGRRRPFLDALALRAVWPQPDVLAALRNAPHRPGHRRAARHRGQLRRRYGDRHGVQDVGSESRRARGDREVGGRHVPCAPRAFPGHAGRVDEEGARLGRRRARASRCLRMGRSRPHRSSAPLNRTPRQLP